MSLLTRLLAPLEGEEPIPIHQFMAAIAEFDRGEVTAQAVFDAFDMTQAEENQLTAWYTANIQPGILKREEVHDILLLGEGGQYTFNQAKNRLNLT